MPAQEIPFIGGAYTTRSKNLNAQVCQNLYPEMDSTGGKSVLSLRGTPGFILWTDTGDGREIRNWILFSDDIIAVIGNTVYQITLGKVSNSIGTIGTATGWVDLNNDGIYVSIFDSTGGWTWDGGTFAAIADGDLPTPSSSTYQDGYHIVVREDTDEIYISAQDDPTSWDATDFATAEGAGDKLVVTRSIQRQLWLIGEKTTEIWYNSGESFPFTRNPGGFINIGCSAKRSVATIESHILWLDDRFRVVMNAGLQITPVSTYQIEYQISLLDHKEDAVGFCYYQEGHFFYVLSINNKTLCYDISTGLWHTRASGGNDLRELANCAIQFDNKVLVGDYENGKIYEYSLDAYDDAGITKRAIRASQVINNNQQRIFFNSLQLDMETGIGLAVGTGSDPQIMLDYSNDSGHTWCSARWGSLGKVGEYETRVKWNRLGSARNRIFRVTISDPVKRYIFGAYLDGVAGNG